MSGTRVAHNTAYLVSAFIGQKILAFAYFIVVARHAGVEGTGRYFLALTFTTMFSIFVDLGLSNIVVRETAKFPEKAQPILSTVLGLKAGLAVLTVAATLIMARLLNYPPETRFMITLASAVMVLDSIHLVFYAAMRGFQNLRYEAIGVVSGQAVTISAGLLFIFLGLPLYWLIIALFLGSSWNVIWSASVLRRRFGIRPALELDRDLLKFLWAVTVPFALAGVFSRIYSYIDSVMLSRLGTESQVGLYGVAYKLTFAFQFLPMAFAAAIYPAMSEFYVKDRQQLSRIFASALKYLGLAAVPVSFGICVLAAPIIRLVYGPAFAGAVMPLQIVILSLIPAYLYWPAGSLLNACDRQAQNTAVMALTMTSNILLNAVFIPLFGASGAAAAALICNTILFGGALWVSRQVTPHDWRAVFLPLARIFAAGLIMVVPLVILRERIHVVPLILLGGAVYVAALYPLGALSVAETRRLVAVFLRRGRGVSDLMV